MLYIVATPIGNLKEITYRAVEVLKEVDFIAAEDTRRTAILLNEYGIKKPMISYQKFNEKRAADSLISSLKEGKNIALVSDAGMPLISDPGAILVDELSKEGLEYTVVSGPCAAVNAVVLSGLDCSRFYMAGFLPEKAGKKKEFLEKLMYLESTLVFYVPPHNALDDLAFLFKVLGNRRVSIIREISKMFEEVVRGHLGEIPDFTVKGEMVIVVEGAGSPSGELNSLTETEHVKHYMAAGFTKNDAVKRAAKDRGVAKSEIYKQTLDI